MYKNHKVMFINRCLLENSQVPTRNRGRGVLRVMKVHQLLNLLCVPVIITQLVIVASPEEEKPTWLCVGFEWTTTFLWINGYLKGLSVALGR